MPVLTEAELKESLSEATLRAEETDAAIQGLAKDAEDGVIEELEAKYEAQTLEVRNLAKAIERKEKMKAAIAEVPRAKEERTAPGVQVTGEPLTYRSAREGGNHSFFSDAYMASKHGDYAAQARLQRHTREMEIEQRAITTASGQGIGLVPPLYLQDQIAYFARVGRPFANALNSMPLPDTGVSFNIPRITTGATAAVQTEGSGVNDSSPVTDDITLALNTVAGKVDMSRQLAERSTPQADQIVGNDLAADYAKQLDAQLLNQATNGITVLAGVNAVTFTSASPTVPLLYSKFADAVQQIHTNRFMPPDLIVMHPRRWGWMLAALDSTNRPLIVPFAGPVGSPAFNPAGNLQQVAAQGAVGSTHGLPIVTDANIGTTLGAGTEDLIVVTRVEDQAFFEQPTPTIKVYEEVLSGNLQVRVEAYGYFAFTFNRLAKATSRIAGTGLIAPTF